MIVLPYHHPLAVAKRYGTLDRLSGGRVILGVGVGSLQPEFDLLGVDFDRPRRALRGCPARPARRARPAPARPTDGSHYQFSDFIIDPCAVQAHLPIWIGGRSARSLRRALELADGWDPFGLDLAQLGDLLARARESPQWRESFEVVLSPEAPLALDDVGRTQDTIAAYARIGATAMNLRFQHRSLEHYLELLEQVRGEVMP